MNDRSHARAPSGRAAQYVFLDGPLARRILVSTDVHHRGERIDVGVIDVGLDGEDLPSFGYAVHAPARPGRRGRLRYVGPAPDPSPVPA
ncbi:hypothetical protein [Actinotalea sp. K2]|uniref:hypothetical protein n=1 Tax=Actinotalea sp. K2 TaxID=2939438 RepID=UPI002016ABC9|nr:hypothetical protein [Actinotalea sp. K2]MCL3861172.1 hypothetical protein [Actinotalea sp. K2]